MRRVMRSYRSLIRQPHAQRTPLFFVVMLYLEGMAKTPPDDDDKAGSIRSSAKSRSQVSRASSRRPLDPVGEHEDLRSDIQEGNQSEVARTIPIHTFVRTPYPLFDFSST